MIIEDKKYALKVLKKDGLYLKNVTEKLTQKNTQKKVRI